MLRLSLKNSHLFFDSSHQEACIFRVSEDSIIRCLLLTYMVLHIYASFLHYASSPFPFSPPLQKGKSKEEDSWVHQGIFRLSMDSRDCHTNHFNHENVGWRLKCQVWKNWTLYRKLMFQIRSSAQKISHASDVGYLAPITLSPRKRPNQFNFRLFSYEPMTS